jgi:hypothetical protein
MTVVTPTAGVVPHREDGPGSSPALPPFHSVGCIDGLGSPIIGARGQPPLGLALRIAPAAGETEAFEVAVLDRGGATLLSLGPFGEEDVVAVWRSLGASSGLPLIIERADGTREMPYPQIGRLQLGAVRIRRRHGLLNGRRPRFLVRRKTGRLPLRPSVHREREIIGGRV